MKCLTCLLFACLALLLPCGVCAAESSAPVNVKENVRKASANLKLLSREQREAALAEVYGLLFMPDGKKAAYSSKTSYQKVEHTDRNGRIRESVPFHRVSSGACFVGADGKLYDFYAALPARDGASQKKKEAWNLAKLYIYRAGKGAVQPRFEAELAEMEAQRAVHFLRQMTPALRQSLFAEMLDMLYTEDGSKPYTGEERLETISGVKVPYRRVSRSARFVDAEGLSHSYYGVKDEVRAKDNSWYTWWGGVKLALHRLGKEKIFTPFKEEIRAMKEHASVLSTAH